MTKKEFLSELSGRLSNIPEEEREKSLSFYAEMIDDRIEDGMSEQDATAALGNIDDIAKNIVGDMSFRTLMKANVEKAKSHFSSKSLWIVLLIIGSVVWLPLLAAFFCAIISIYAALWSVIISMWACVGAFGISGVGTVAGGIIAIGVFSPASGICAIGVGMVLFSLMLFLIKPMFSASREFVRATAFVIKKIKLLLVHKDAERKGCNNEIK